LGGAGSAGIQADGVASKGGGDEHFAAVHGVNSRRDGHLTQIAQALRAFAPFFGTGQGGQKHGGENRNDGNNDEQLNQGEGRPASHTLLGYWPHSFHTGLSMEAKIP
jgi:hypothetical protein